MMFSHLRHIYDPRERALVGVADLVIGAATWPSRLRARPPAVSPPRRILLLRLERIGDLLMTIGAIESLRATWPSARIDLVVGSWNAGVAGQLRAVDRVLTLDAPWLSRGEGAASPAALLAHARGWRRDRYDLAINLEGDLRSNLLIGVSGAPVRVGFPMAGGGALLTDAVPHDPKGHTDENTRRLVRTAAARFGTPFVDQPPRFPRFDLPDDAIARADQRIAEAGLPVGRRLIGLHASGGRAIKQWHPDRFGRAVGRIAEATGAAVVLTGTRDEHAIVQAARDAIPAGIDVADLSGPLDLLTLAALLSRLTAYVTGDTGPMHLAAAMGTPIVAVFGLSDPARYAPIARRRRLVRIDLWCSPCNRVRRPPERCRGHVPDCLEGISADMVERAGLELMAEVLGETARSGPGGDSP